MKRSGKFYRNNESDVMKRLGLKPTKNSGSGWIEKEDGQSDKIICQLKSTDKESIKINKLDIDTLEYNASVSHKIPVFAIQFINNSIYILVKPENLIDVCRYIKTGEVPDDSSFITLQSDDIKHKSVKTIKSSEKARNTFKKKKLKEYEGRRKKKWFRK